MGTYGKILYLYMGKCMKMLGDACDSQHCTINITQQITYETMIWRMLIWTYIKKNIPRLWNICEVMHIQTPVGVKRASLFRKKYNSADGIALLLWRGPSFLPAIDDPQELPACYFSQFFSDHINSINCRQHLWHPKKRLQHLIWLKQCFLFTTILSF